ncbi:hypothetical protein A6R68_19945, partial [Neotoma lepida]
YEQAFLTSLVGLRPEKYFWTGLSDVQNKGTFRWTVDEQVQFTHWNADMPDPAVTADGWVIYKDYQYYFSKEKDTMDNARAFCMKHFGFWNDINCGYPNNFICQRHNNSINATVIPTTPPT